VKKTEVPPAMRVQLARLFGADSRIAKATNRSDKDWQRDLQLVLSELYRYLEANIDTDLIHLRMLESGFYAAHQGLQGEDFWPAYAEGITRIVLCLMGGYPDHRKCKANSKKKAAHYKLDNDRSTIFARNADQRLHTYFGLPQAWLI
jgi:hypothetical protein